MKTEQIIKRLSDAIRTNSMIDIVYLNEELKKELIAEADTKRTGNKSRTKVFDKILKESIKICDNMNVTSNFIIKPFIIDKYMIFSTPYRFIATTEHTQHDTNEAPEHMKQTYLNLIREAEEAPQNCYKYNRVNLPTAAEMKVYLKIIKATHRTKYGKAPENYIVSIEDKIYLNLEYLIEAIEATGSNELYYNAEITSRGTSIINNNTIASIMPTKPRTDKVIFELDLLKYDLFISEMTGKATITDREMYSDKAETETA